MGNRFVYLLNHHASEFSYIGQSSRGMKRPRAHAHASVVAARLPVSKWARKHPDYAITVVEECESKDSLDEAEKFYIAYFRSVGLPLLNITSGGGGIVGYRASESTRRALSERLRGRVFSEATKKRISVGVKASEPARSQKISQAKALRTTKYTKITDANLRRSPEVYKAVAAKLTGSKYSPERYARMDVERLRALAKASHERAVERRTIPCAHCGRFWLPVSRTRSRSNRGCSPKCRGALLSASRGGRTCNFDGCLKKHVARGLCGKHYAQQFPPNRSSRKEFVK